MNGSVRIVGIVVARMGSTRVPGKSVLELAGKPLLWHVIESVKRAEGLDDVCLATSNLPQDDPLAEIAARCEVGCFRGDPERVLDRVYGAAKKLEADAIVDVGGDCPFIYPQILDDAIGEFLRHGCDYLCNYEPPTFPEGLDVNVVAMRALEAAHRLAIAPSQRVHPFSYLTRHRDAFDIKNYEMSPDLSEYHWSVDFPEDVAFVKAVYDRLYWPGEPITMKAILELIERDPLVAGLNRAIMKPKVLHAFWNSPGIMRDMNEDIAALARLGQRAAAESDSDTASRCYGEIEAIASELRRQTEFKAEAQ